MAPPPYTLPQNNQPVTDPKTGIMTWSWYQFIRFLFQGTGSGVPLGTAATKNASSAADTIVASVTTPVVVGHVAKFADTSGTIQDGGALGTAASQNIGTSGANVPLLSGANIWSGTQTFGSGDLIAPNITNTGVLTLPTSSDTLVGRATVDTLTNKSIDVATNTIAFHQLANSIAVNVALNNTGSFFDGPSVAQGTVGTWFASGSVTVTDTVGAASFYVVLWDGTTAIASGVVNTQGANSDLTCSLSGIMTSPAANLRISVKDISSVHGQIIANDTALTKDSTLTVFRIN